MHWVIEYRPKLIVLILKLTVLTSFCFACIPSLTKLELKCNTLIVLLQSASVSVLDVAAELGQKQKQKMIQNKTTQTKACKQSNDNVDDIGKLPVWHLESVLQRFSQSKTH